MKNLKIITIPNFPPLLWRGVVGEVFKTPSLCNIPLIPSKKGDRQKPATAQNFSSSILKCWKRRVIKPEKQFNEPFFFTKSMQKYVFI